MNTKQFWLKTGERAIKTFAQTLAALLSTVVASGQGIESVNWIQALSIAGLAMVFSLLTSLGSAAVNGETPSLVKE